MNRRVRNHHMAVFTEDHGAGRHHFFFKRRGRNHHFHGRPRLVRIRQSTIAPSIGRQRGDDIRIESRTNGHRKNRTRLRLHDDDCPGLGMGMSDGLLEFFFCNVLDDLVDGQRESMSRRRHLLRQTLGKNSAA